MEHSDSENNTALMPRWLRWLALAAWVGVIFFFWRHRGDITIEGILRFTPRNLWFAAAVMLGLFMLKSISVVVYCAPLYAASGILFPMPMAIGVNIVGTALMATIPYLFGRHIGAEAMDRFVEKHPKMEVLTSFHSDNEFRFTFLIRAINLLSLDLVSAYFGAVRMNYAPYLLGSIAGMLAPCVLYPVLGDNITDPDSPQFLIAAGIQLAIMIVSFVLAFRMRKRTPPLRGEEEGTT